MGSRNTPPEQDLPNISRRSLIATAGVAAGTAALATLIPELGAQSPQKPAVPAAAIMNCENECS